MGPTDQKSGRDTDPRAYRPKTLASEVAARGRLPVRECIELGLRLCEALVHLHCSGLVHRDIKPANILVVNGEPKLADIGLVTKFAEPTSYVGTAGFIPPEGPGTARADLYSLGKLLYEASTGQDRQQFPVLPPGFDAWPDAREFLEFNEIITKACSEDWRVRYPSAQTMQPRPAVSAQRKLGFDGADMEFGRSLHAATQSHNPTQQPRARGRL